MSKFTYNGNNSSIKVTGVLFVKGIETELTVEQVKAFKADGFGKAFLADGSILETKAAKPAPKAEPKPTKAYAKTAK